MRFAAADFVSYLNLPVDACSCSLCGLMPEVLEMRTYLCRECWRAWHFAGRPYLPAA